MKKLRIAQIAPPFLSVPPKTFGGTEAVVSNITEELVKRGHEVTLFASGDSQTTAKLEYTFQQALNYEELEKTLSPLGQKLRWMYSLPVFMHVIKALEQEKKFDIIHDHTHYLTCFFSEFLKTPLLSTYHGSFTLAEQSPIEKMLLEKYKNLNWVAISESQKSESKIKLNIVSTIYNGIHINEFSYQEKPQEYLIWLGRITDRKGIEEAITVAKTLNKQLIISGNIKDRDMEYFETKIKAHIDGQQIVYAGVADFKKKHELLRNAKALLYPVKWEEPFGMVMIEAMAVGTPVIGFRRGAVAEVVQDKKTGFIVDTLDEMIAKTKQLYELSLYEYIFMRRESRLRVKKLFTVETMVDQYEALYVKLGNFSENEG